jgi:hypothetical protein
MILLSLADWELLEVAQERRSRVGTPATEEWFGNTETVIGRINGLFVLLRIVDLLDLVNRATKGNLIIKGGNSHIVRQN